MQPTLNSWLIERTEIQSSLLKRPVTVDFYLPRSIADTGQLSLLLINDGQNLDEMNFSGLMEDGVASGAIRPVLCAGIHANADRKMEYGTAGFPDYLGRGAKSAAYQQFLVKELIPYIKTTYHVPQFRMQAVAGFSLGGLSALDTVWNHPGLFSVAGVFSGSLWWRSCGLEDGYNEDTDRIMHRRVQEGTFHEGLRFYFTTGSLDETADRNKNGIIDSIDDTRSLIDALKEKGYSDTAIHYINYEDGKHDIPTWGRAMPHFLHWAFGTAL